MSEKIQPRVAILKTDGINCDEETANAFETAGGQAEIVHVNQFRSKEDSLKNYQILTIPGGFSYGDDVFSGKILALELNSFLEDEIREFVYTKESLILGICNGFQVLVRTGLLPFGEIGQMKATLAHNESGHFECRWVNLNVETGSACSFLAGMDDFVSYQVAHGEGKFYAQPDVIEKIETDNLVVFRYANSLNNPTQDYPSNPNGSINAIAGVCDPTGRVLGLMPHPERFVRQYQYPNWRQKRDHIPQGLQFFEKLVDYFL